MDSILLYGGPLALCAGIASFFSYFHIGEHHLYGMLYVQVFTAACILSTIGLVHILQMTASLAISSTAILAFLWLTGVYGSCLIWRAFFNPLNRFPGPWYARMTRLYMSAKLRNLDAYHVLAGLHAKYGRIVRTGPNDVSIVDPDFMQPSYGANSTVTKSSWYDVGGDAVSMHTTRDRAMHDRRRRFWAPAFSDKALRNYESIVQVFNDKLRQRIKEFGGAPINMTKWFNLYSFDVMGRLAFGKDYNMLDSGERHWALDLLTEGMSVGARQPPTWLFRLALAIPGLASGYYRFLNFCTEELKSRVEKGDNEDGNKDITSWLLKAYKGQEYPHRDAFLQGDARLIIVAGSDTTAATLTYLFYHLAQEPEQVAKLRAELRPLTRGEWSDRDIQHADHLNGVINEALRLHPPVPSGVSRKTPNEGLCVGDTFIPGNTQFVIPQFPLGRDETIYEDALSFVPERWYSKPEMVKHPDAFAPFSMGPYNCIGRGLARMELRTVTAQLILDYNVALAPGEDGMRILTQTHDHFTLTLGQLDLVFTPAEVELA